MDVFGFLQIIIALIFIYLIVSLVVSELQEQLAALIQWRARNLKTAIEIFTGPEFAQELYSTDNNSLFSGFSQYTNQRTGSSVGPSYIEKEIFAESLMGIIQMELKKLKDLSGEDEDLTLSPEHLLFPEDQDPNIKAPNITEVLDKLPKKYPKLIERLKEIAYITKLKHNPATVKHFTAEIANTFNEVMERTSGVYKRNAKGVSLLLGILAASLFNIDAFHILHTLYTDPDLRQGFDNLATRMVKINNDCLESADNNEEEIRNCQTNLEAENERIKTSLVENQSLPIGWDENGWFNGEQIEAQGKLRQVSLGWFISAIAISMGAPFWFELLGKVINVRSTVRPLSSQEEN